MTKKIAILLAEGFEEIEAVVPVDVLRRLGFNVILAGATKSVKGSHGIPINPDCLISDLEVEELDALILPGGMPGAANLRANSAVIAMLKEMYESGKTTAALCAAPIVFNAAGIINKKKVTSHPSVKSELVNSTYTGKQTEVDGNVITGKGPGAAFEFACKVAEALGKKDEAGQMMDEMFVGKK